MLVETHSLKPYRQRVLGTYVLVEESLRLLGAEGASLDRAIATDRASRPATEVMTWKARPTPLYVIPDYKGIAHTRRLSPASGGKEISWLGRAVTQRMPVIGKDPDTVVTLPAAWWVPVTKPDVVALLKLHGVEVETLTAAQTITLDMVRLRGPRLKAADEGHIPLVAAAYAHSARSETYPVGSVLAPHHRQSSNPCPD